ncbi:MAG: hypothetical protein H6970_03190 [Gammaproteobacteria bacterium]|nr:hypothetical protein [Gammaproteobacteria bacterium]MCP5424063.1 hypothetical protein [Gammaproteobacteria bacterium]
MNISRLILIPLLGTLSLPIAAQQVGLTGSELSMWCNHPLLVSMAQVMYQWHLENRLWRAWFKRLRNKRTSRYWTINQYDWAGTNIYIPVDYGSESWSLRSR